ncbi:hypothetical protein BLOT_014330, partial [Blomia tropicalis]
MRCVNSLYPNHGAMDGFKPKLRLRQKRRLVALLHPGKMGASTLGAMRTLFQIPILEFIHLNQNQESKYSITNNSGFNDENCGPIILF